jgi:uncharacterized SAM-binding protein YcdF (DUF218 family)
MELGALKPLLTGLLMPPASLLLTALLGVWLASRKKHGGLALITLSLVLLGLLGCHGTAVWLARHALPQFAPASHASLKAGKVQAIVVLGGGVLPQAPEYGQPQPGNSTAARLRYGLWLARQSGLPIAFTGGMGWAASDTQQETEAQVAGRVASQDYGVTLRWSESQSRDTAENARLLAPLLQRDGVKRIALVTDAWHMPRAVAGFEKAGLIVTPAPVGYILPVQHGLLEWIPSANGLLASHKVLHECVALLATRLIAR